MTAIDLPRALEDYFAFAELPSNRQGRRFTITFMYFDGERLDRLQWWWQLSAVQERIGGEAGIESLRREAIERFRSHIERWLVTSQRRLFDGAPFPRVEPLVVAAPAPAPSAEAASTAAAADATVVPWPVDRVANG